jgi:hypothetical protein
MDLVRHGLDEGAQEVCGGVRRRFVVQFGEDELAGALDGDGEVEFALGGVQLGDVDMEEADRVRP